MATIAGGNTIAGAFGLRRNPGAPVNGTTHKGAPVGALLLDTTNARTYQNTGTPIAPVWTLVGAQA